MIKIFAVLAVFWNAAWAAGGEPSRILELKDKTTARVSHGPKAWVEDQVVCVEKGQETSACGIVVEATEVDATVEWDFVNTELLLGDVVAPPKGTKTKDLIPLREGRHVHFVPRWKQRWLVRSALAYDLQLWVGSVAVDRAISGHVMYGAKVEMIDFFNRSDLDGTGVMLTRTFYTLPRFSGVGAQVGVGAIFFRGIGTAGLVQHTSFVVEASATWRFSLARWLAVGFQFGLRYVTPPSLPGVTMPAFHKVRSAIGMDLAIRL